MARLTRPARLSDGTLVPYSFGVSTRPFLGRDLVWHGGNVDSHSTMIAPLPEQDVRVVILTTRDFLWPTDLMPALIELGRSALVRTSCGRAGRPAVNRSIGITPEGRRVA
jgi:hypothetical protein